MTVHLLPLFFLYDNGIFLDFCLHFVLSFTAFIWVYYIHWISVILPYSKSFKVVVVIVLCEVDIFY